MSARGALLAIVVSVLASWPAPGAERYTRGQGLYKESELAYNAGRFAEAVEKLREAIREDPAEGLAKFRHTGLNQEDYLPHYYLGLSLERLGRPLEALAALQESRRQGAISGRPALARSLDEKIRRLQASTAPTPSPTPTATVAPAAPALEPHPVPVVPSPAPDAGPPPPAPSLAPIRAARTLPVPRLGPTVVVGAAPVGPADLLETREGMRLFYQGRYPEAVRRLEPVATRSPLARLFLAYALAGRYILEGESNADLLARARREHSAASSSRAVFPDELVSPAVRKVLEAPR